MINYYDKWDFDHIFKNYDGSNGYIALEPYQGGLNNIRQSLELALCISYLTNRTLLVPDLDIQNYYHLELNKTAAHTCLDFFNVNDMGIKTMLLSDFCLERDIYPSYKELMSYSNVIKHETLWGRNNILNFTDLSEREILNSHPRNRNSYRDDHIFVCQNIMDKSADGRDVVFFDRNHLGIFYQIISSEKNKELKMLVAKYFKFKKEIFDVAQEMINILGDKQYYSIHIRGGDYQFFDLRISVKDICNNIKNIIPYKSTLYISTDILKGGTPNDLVSGSSEYAGVEGAEEDKSYFKELEDKYHIIFYSDIEERIKLDKNFNKNWIPAIEQLICTRAIKFVGMKLSTFSSYIFRLRGYMNDIEDKNFYEQQYSDYLDKQITYKEEDKWWCAWAREYKDAWDFTK